MIDFTMEGIKNTFTWTNEGKKMIKDSERSLSTSYVISTNVREIFVGTNFEEGITCGNCKSTTIIFVIFENFVN